MPNLGAVNEEQIDMMKNMMDTDSGRDMMKNMMKAQFGMDVSDEQLKFMKGMMNKETLNMAQQQMAQNPNMRMPAGPGFAGPMPTAPANSSSTQNGEQVMPGAPTMPTMPNMGNPDAMNDMMKDMANGQQPGIDSLLKNKDMIKSMMQMIKSNPAMLRMMAAQMGDDNPMSKYIKNKSDDELKKLAVWLERGVNVLSFCYPAFKVIKNNFRYLVGLFLAWIVYRYVI